MSTNLVRLLRGATLALAAACATANAADWANLATVSMTDATHPKLTSGYGCRTDGKDILCDSAASAVSFGSGGLIDAGGLTVMGSVSASAVSATYISGTVIQVNASTMPCSTGINGAIRYSSISNTLEVCTGTTWSGLSSNTTPGNLSGGGSATAVAFWNGPSSLTYDAGLYWDNVNKRLGVSTTIPSRSLVLHVTNSDGLRLEANSGPGSYFTELINQYNYAEPFFLASQNEKVIGRKRMNVFTEGYLNDYYGLDFSTGTNDPDLAHVRMYISQAGLVGIGTVTPTSKLSIKGASSAPSLTAKASAVANFRVADTASSEMVVGGDIALPYAWWLQVRNAAVDGASYPLSLNPLGGNVGIGTTNPAAHLELANANASSYGGSATTGFKITNADLGSSTGYIGMDIEAPYNTGTPLSGVVRMNRGTGNIFNGMEIGTYSNHPLRFITDASSENGQERLRIAANGNVGISNTNPIAKLDVRGTVSASDAIQVGQSNLACINEISGSIRFNTTSNTLQVCTNTGWTSLSSNTITGSGISGGSATAIAFWNGPSSISYDSGLYWDDINKRLGVGTTSPSDALEVFGSGSGLSLKGSRNASDQLVSAVNFRNRWWYDDYVFAQVAAKTKPGTYEHGASELVFSTNAGAAPALAERMRITSAGNIGIGTATPSGTLHLLGNISTYASSTLQIANASSSYSQNPLFLTQGWTGNYDGFGIIGVSKTAAIMLEPTKGMAIFPAAAEVFDGAPFRSFSTGYASYKPYTSASAGDSLFDTIGDYRFLSEEAGTYVGRQALRITSSGTVALGFGGSNAYTRTASAWYPSATLHVSGTELITSWTGINFSSAGNVTPTAPLEVSGTVSATRFLGDGSGLTGIGSADRIVSGTTSIIANNNSFVSVTLGGVDRGRLNAIGPLVFSKGTLSSPNKWIDSTGFAEFGTVARFTGDGSASIQIQSSDNAGPAMLWFSGAGDRGHIYADPTYSMYVTPNDLYRKANLIFMPMTGTYGMSVGVNTASPVATLQVSGTFTVSNSIQNAAAPSIYVSNNTAGFVGVGTNNPLERLSVSNGNILLYNSGALSSNLRWNGSSWEYPSNNYPSYIWQTNFNDSSIRLVTAPPSAAGPATIATRLVVNTVNGNVGIDTPTPSQTLQVAGSALITSWTGINFSSAGNVTPTAPLEVSGTVSATRFVGDGSGLTGVIAGATDRIISGTNAGTSMIAVSDTGYISITQNNGTNTGWFDPTRGLVTLGVSSTGPISGTNGYFSGNIGIGTELAATQQQLTISGTSAQGIRLTGSIGSSWDILRYSTGGLQFQEAGQATRLTLMPGGKVGIGTTSPSATLELANTSTPPQLRLNGAYTDGSSKITFAENNNDAEAIYYDGAANRLDVQDVISGTAIASFQRNNGSPKFGVGTNLVYPSTFQIGLPPSTGSLNAAGVQGGFVAQVSGSAAVWQFWNGNTSNVSGTGTELSLPVFNGAAGLRIRSMGSSSGGYSTGNYDGFISTGQGNSYLHFSAGNAGNTNIKQMTLTPSGSLAIGTTTPGSSLTVVGEIQVSSSGGACLSSTNGGAIRYASNSLYFCNNTNAWTQVGTGAGSLSGGGSATAIAFWNGPTSLTYESATTSGLYWDHVNGRLGVGMNNPNANLQVSGSLVVSSTGQGAGNPTLYVSSSGLIGVGTTAPYYQMDIYRNDPSNAAAIRAYNGDATATSQAQIEAGNGNGVVNRITAYGSTGYYGTYSNHPVAFTTSNTTRLYISNTGNVGIGTITPATPLQVSGTATMNMANLVSQSITSLTGAGGNQLVSGTANVTVSKDSTVTITVGGSPVFVVNGSGANVKGGLTFSDLSNFYMSPNIGTGYPGINFDAADFVDYRRDIDQMRFQAGGHLGMTLGSNGNLTVMGSGTTCTIGSGTGTTSCTSDRRLKDRIKPITGALEKLEFIQGVTYHWKDPANSGPEHIGVIAQDVEKVFPQAVDQVSNTALGTAKTVDYAVLVAPAIEAIKELKADNDDLRAKIKEANDSFRVQIKAANDNAASLRTELDDMRNHLQTLEVNAKKK